MQQSPLLQFESAAFAVEPGGDEETNPGIFGKALALWFAEQLQCRHVSVGEIVAEDFGWLVLVQSTSHRLYVACASEDGETKKWRAFVFAEGRLLARILGKDESVESVASLYATIKQTLGSSPSIGNVSEVSHNG